MRFSTCPKAGSALTSAWPEVLALVVAFALSAHAPAHAAPNSATGAIRGGALPLPRDELTPQQRARIKSALDSNVETLRRAGRLPAVSPKAAPVSPLQWPLVLVFGHPEKVARTITNYVDHDPGYPNQLQDYNCGTRTYDQANGYNHQGTDITSFPFAWRKMDNDEAIVVAAAPGTIVMKEDGQFDRSCELNDNPWNAVYIRHPDGSIAWYGHLKSGSLTSKALGASVQTGEFLGVMGSSGDSTGPHLHFEIHDGSGQLIDPFAGACNTINAESWWTQQRTYDEPAIDLVMTGDAPVDFTPCPMREVEHRSSYFQPGQLVFLTAFLADQERSDAAVFNVYAPNGTLYGTTTIASGADYYAASFWEWSVTVPMAGGDGTWRFEVAFHGQTQSVAFQVGASEPPRAEIVEYYAASLDHYFMTGFSFEQAAVDAGTPIAGWTRTGRSFPAYSDVGSGLSAVCRFFGTPGVGFSTHFYTLFDFECDVLKLEAAWIFEANAFYIAAPDGLQCPASTRPAYRLYNNGMGGQPNHRYTTSWPTIDAMQTLGWLLEGLAFCAPL